MHKFVTTTKTTSFDFKYEHNTKMLFTNNIIAAIYLMLMLLSDGGGNPGDKNQQQCDCWGHHLTVSPQCSIRYHRA